MLFKMLSLGKSTTLTSVTTYQRDQIEQLFAQRAIVNPEKFF
jgi:hypothetical protein